MSQTSTGGPKLRRDALRNRELLIEAATAVLRELGLEAPLDEIARRAGVGNATLYRRFPTREDLFEAVFENAGAEFREIGERVLAIEDGWAGLAEFLTNACEFMGNDRGLCEVMTQRMSLSPVCNEIRTYGDKILGELLSRAQSQGTVRADLKLTDLLFIMSSLQGVITGSATFFPDAWRRHLMITLDGLRPACPSELPPPSMTYQEMFDAAPNFNQAPGRRPRP
ncbi:MAG TPA: TetR/AcrR family transcriptional regulator [Pseudonocardia sp.]|jgi:AcrR family transcriptional regulator|nr:TetR/AcrR family transcriptional regulator [Pseudonocardia sp.]